LLHSATSDITVPIRLGGGINEWLWKGSALVHAAAIEIVAAIQPEVFLRYRLAFSSPSYFPSGQQLQIDDEIVELARNTNALPYELFFYRYRHGNPMLNARVDISAPIGDPNGRMWQELAPEQIDLTKSILSQATSLPVYPEITLLGFLAENIRFYRSFNFGRQSPPRQPQQADLPNDFLLEDGSNLGLVLNNLEVNGLKKRIISVLQ